MPNHLWVGMAALALAMAGCTGNFDIKQTEPIRVQIDGESQDGRVESGSSNERKEFTIERTQEVEAVKVVVKVIQVEDDDDGGPSPSATSTNATGNTTAPPQNETAAEPAIIVIIIEDRDTKEKLEERRVEADAQGTSVELVVNVKGHDNVVIVTQAVEGIADVSVAAKSGTEAASPTSGNATTSASPTTSGR